MAFLGCNGLKNEKGFVILHDVLYDYFGNDTVLVIPNGVTSIGRSAFSGCGDLTGVTIPNSVTNIGYEAFSGCSGLTSMTLPFVGARRGNSGSSDAVFGYIFGTSSYTGGRNVSQHYSLYYSYGSPITYYIPSSLKSVTITDETVFGYGAFSGCSGLTSVTVPNSVMSIGGQAFSGCSGLASVTIPDSVTSIGDYAFSGCSGLMSISVGSVNANYSSINGLLLSKDGKTLIQGVNDDVAIPDGVTSIGSSAFEGYSGLTSVTVPNSVTSIGDKAFYGCSGLVSVTVPDSVTNIDRTAFSYCRGLMSISVSSGNARYSSKNGFLLSKDGRTLIQGVNGDAAIPEGVKSIRYGAFVGCSGLTSVTIPDSVTSIGKEAFEGCYGLMSVTIGNGVTSIGDYAFSVCEGLTSVTIPNSVTSIGEGAFSNCYGLMSVTIGSGVTSIGGGAFSDCSGLTSVTIPNSVTSIGDYAFAYCEGLTSVTIPNSVTNIGDGAFSYCSGLTGVTIPDSVTSIGDDAFSYCSGLTSVTIPQCVCDNVLSQYFSHSESIKNVVIADGVTRIGDDAFYNCTNLTSVVIPNSVTSIGKRAFDYCNDSLCDTTTIAGVILVDGWAIGCTASLLGHLNLTGVRGIGGGAFSYCSGLMSVTIPDNVKSIGEDAFYECSGLRSVMIPNSVMSIGSFAFCGCSELRSVTIGNGVTSVGNSAFGGCSGLTSVTIPNNVKQIGDYAFDCCRGLASVTIGGSVTSIGDYAFAYCEGLTSVTIPNSVTRIGDGAFSGCSGLMSATIGDGVMYVGEGAFDSCNANLYDTTTITGIKLVDGWVVERNLSLYGHLHLAGVRGFGKSAFAGCSGLMSVTIPNGVKSIGDDAFYYCSGLTSVTIPNSVVYIGAGAFSGCYGLTSVTIGSGVKSIGDEAFYNCNGLTGVTIPNGVTSIGDYAFSGCSGLMSVTIPNSVMSIGSSAFCGCSGLRSVTIGDGVTSIGDYAFSSCSGLMSVTIPNRVTSIGNYAFSDCDGLASVTIPNSVKSIGDYAFSWCYGLTSLAIPNSVTRIGERAFSDCRGLAIVTIPNSVTGIGDYAFYNCNNLTKARVPRALENMIAEKGVFEYCSPDLVVEYYDIPTYEFFAGIKDEVNIGLVSYSANGLPSGLTYAANTGKVSGTAKTAGTYEATFSKKGEQDVVLQFVVHKAYTVVFDANGGTPKSMNIAQYSGRTFAMPSDPTWADHVFMGWWTEKDGGERVTDATVFRDGAYETLYAHWEYVKLVLELDDAYETEGDGSFDLPLNIVSLSSPNVTVKGLPAGLKYDAKTGAITGKATKPGVYTVTVSATNATVKKPTEDSTATFLLTVPNLEDGEVPVGGYYGPFIPGVYCQETINEAAGCTVTGLPTGMKWTAKDIKDNKTKLVTVPANSYYGTPTKPGYYTVYFTKTVKEGKVKVKHTSTAIFEVGPLPVLTLEKSGEGTGKVTGAGAYAANKKVTLKAAADTKDAAATATKPATVKSVFNGWYDEYGMLLSQAASYSYVMPDEDTVLTAKFIPATADAINSFEVAGIPFDAETTSVSTNVPAGVYFQWPIDVDAESLPTVKVSGLPTGLKFTAKDIVDSKTKLVTVPANTIYGTPTAASKFDKKLNGIKPSVVKISVTTAGKTKFDCTINMTVDAMQDWAYGSFNGGGVTGQGALTITKDSGKISGKYFDENGLTWTLSAISFAEYDETTYATILTAKSEKEARTYELYVAEGALGGEAQLWSEDEDGNPVMVAYFYQTDWKSGVWKTPASKFAKATVVEYEAKDAADNQGTVSLKFAASGAVTAKGVFITGKDKNNKDVKYSASGSSVLIPTGTIGEGKFTAKVYVYFPPKAGKFAGYCEEVSLEWDGAAFTISQ